MSLVHSTQTVKDEYENIYLNVTITNNTNSPQPAQYYSSFTNAIVSRASDYKLAVLRFFIPGNLIPLFIFGAGGAEYWITVTNTSNGQVTYNQVQYTATSYPFANYSLLGVWSYDQFLTSINSALASAYSTAGGSGQAPFFFWQPSTSLFILQFTNSTQYQSFRVGMNWALFQFFPSFPVIINSIGPNPASNDVTIYKTLNTNDPVMFPQGSTGIVQVPTEVNAQYAWNGLIRIFITSSSLNTRPEIQFSNQISDARLPIITDFDPLQVGDFRSNDIFQFVPSAEFRRMDILNEGALKSMDLQFFFMDKGGSQYPIYLSPGSSLNIKFLFEKKNKL